MFEIVRNLAAPVIGMSFIDRYIRGTFPNGRKIVSLNSPTVPVLTVREAETNKTEEEQENIAADIIAEQKYT